MSKREGSSPESSSSTDNKPKKRKRIKIFGPFLEEVKKESRPSQVKFDHLKIPNVTSKIYGEQSGKITSFVKVPQK